MQRRRAAAWLAGTLLALAGALQLQGAAAEPEVLIVEYTSDAVQGATAATGVATAAVDRAVAAASAKAADIGLSASRREAMVAIASEAALRTPAVSALTYSLYKDASDAAINITGFTNYATVLQGAALRTGGADEAARLKQQLESNPSVKRVWYAGTRPLVAPVTDDGLAPMNTHPLHFTPESATDGNSQATGLAALHAAEPLLDGSGQLVCVVDTGIGFINNPLYGECRGINLPKGKCRVVTGYDFVGSEFTGLQSGPAAVRGGAPTDCMGHGSMVASVASTANGVATGAMLGAYRVFGCSGYATDDILIEAIDRAVRDGCDIINLSLATGSGYADSSVFRPVMQNALSKGVLVVKAAGNSGRDGPFNADVATAAGSIALASVGSAMGEPLDSKLMMSRFSSIGPAPDLGLVPSVAAPGALIQVRTMTDDVQFVSGTSFSSPYTAGVLALWLQYKQRAASAIGRRLSIAEAGQAAALRGLVATAKGVRDYGNASFNEPVARMGAGVIQVDAFLHNQVSLSPLMVQLPSALAAPSTHAISVAWDGPPTPGGAITYRLVHEPSSSITLNNGWYGTAAMRKEYVAASVEFEPSAKLVLDTTGGKNATFQVTFSLPPELRASPLLYSGLIKLVPDHAPSRLGLAPLTVPYQGFSQPLSALRIPATPQPEIDEASSEQLAGLQNSICYAPDSKPRFLNAILDAMVNVPDVCTGGITRAPTDVLEVSLAKLQASPECSLRVTVVPEVSMRTLYMDLLNEGGRAIGRLNPLDTSSGNSLATAGEVWSTCLRFNGTFTGSGPRNAGRSRSLVVGRTYSLRARLEGPLAAGDAALGLRPIMNTVNIRGKFLVAA